MNNNNDTEMMSSQVGNDSFVSDPELLYGSAVRLALAEDIVRDICNMVPVIVISGEKGEGKSTLCRMVVDEIPTDWLTIVFEKTVESFEDVVREVARTIGCGEVDVSRSGMSSSIEIIGERLQGIDKQVVTVFDSAEMIYLATLERIRKMLDQLNVEGVKMQVILCGRPLLLENLKQLSIVNFREVPEKRYFVEPLSVEDTGTYIDFLAQNPSSDVSGSFLPAAIQQVHAITNGNILKVHDCAVRISCSDDRDEALAAMVARTSQKKKSFDVAAFVQQITQQIVNRVKSLSRRDQMIGGGVLAAFLVLLLLFSGRGDQEPVAGDSIQKEPVEQTAGPVEPNVPTESEKVSESSSEEKIDKHRQETVVEQEQEKSPEQPQPIADTPETKPSGEPEGVVLQESEGQQNIPVSEEPEKVPAEPESEVVVETPVQPKRVVEEPEAQPDETTSDSVAEVEPAESGNIQEEKVPFEEIPDFAETLPETGEDTPAITLEEEEVNQVEAVEVPLIAPDTYKRVVVESVQSVELPKQPDSESNIVISTLAESEKREIDVITSTPYKVLKPIESLDEPETADSGELEIPSPPVVEEYFFEQPETGVAVRQEEPVEAKIQKPILGQAIVIEGDVAPPVTSNTVTEVVAVAGGGGETLLENRMEAGFPWLAGRRNGSYTMQLMMLSSDDAEAKIKGILSQREYKRASDKFYIFRKNSSPPVYFVFYGEYGNVTEARKARNQIPVFLRNHRPYVLSVPSAMKKVKF